MPNSTLSLLPSYPRIQIHPFQPIILFKVGEIACPAALVDLKMSYLPVLVFMQRLVIYLRSSVLLATLGIKRAKVNVEKFEV